MFLVIRYLPSSVLSHGQVRDHGRSDTVKVKVQERICICLGVMSGHGKDEHLGILWKRG